MRLNYWLHEATGTFPSGVRERLAKDYSAHLADSILAGGTADAFELFGDPKAVRKILGKSYIDDRRLKALRNQPEWIFWLIGGMAVCIHLSLSLSRPTIASTLTVATVIVALTTVWFVSRSWAKPRMVFFRNTLCVMVLVLAQMPYQLAQPFASHLTLALFCVAPVIYLFGLPLMIADDKRIRRTLEIEEISFERRRISLHPDH